MSIAQKLVVCSSFGFVSYGCYRCYDNFNEKYETINNLESNVKSSIQGKFKNCPIYNYDYNNLFNKLDFENNRSQLSSEGAKDNGINNQQTNNFNDLQKLVEIIT